MDKLSFKQAVKQNLIKSAKAYSYLLNKKIIIKIPNSNRTYVLVFNKDNFLHLTGVKTKLNAYQFYKKAYKRKIRTIEFYFDSKLNMKITRIKLKNLININSFFNKEIFVQENFKKGHVECKIASSNQVFTIGFIGVLKYYVPKSLLDKNHLNKEKPIYKIKPKILPKYK